LLISAVIGVTGTTVFPPTNNYTRPKMVGTVKDQIITGKLALEIKNKKENSFFTDFGPAYFQASSIYQQVDDIKLSYLISIYIHFHD